MAVAEAVSRLLTASRTTGIDAVTAPLGLALVAGAGDDKQRHSVSIAGFTCGDSTSAGSEQLIEGLPQTRQLVHEDLPDQGIVHDRVSVDQDVSKSHDPRQLGNARGSSRIYLGELVQCLANYLKLALNRRPEFCIRLVVGKD